MKRNILIRLLTALLAAGMIFAAAIPALAAEGELDLTEAERAYVDSCGPLRVGYVQDRIPVSFMNKDGEADGISRYIFDRVSALAGLEFEYVPLPTGNVTYDILLDMDLDLITSVEYNRENQNARGILISDPYLSSRKVVVARSDWDYTPGSTLDVAIYSGSQTIRKVLTQAYPNFNLVDYDSFPACFDAVLSGETDILIQNQYVVEYWFAKPIYEQLNVIPMLNTDDEMCFSAVVSFDDRPGPSQEDGRMLIDILNKAIARLTEDEVGGYIIRAVLANQYEMGLGDFIYRYRVAVGVFTGAALVIAVLAVLLIRQRVRSLQARADAKAKEDFLSTMSHELRTPLNGLVGLNYLMSEKLDEPEKLSGYLRQSSSTANYLLGLVNDILDMSRLQEGRMELESKPVDMELLADTVQSLTGVAMAEKGIHFRADVSLPCPRIMGDEARIQQVILHFLDNARKFTHEGGHVTLRMEQEVSEDGSVLTRVTVTDDGQGMSEAFQKKVFDTFAKEMDTVSTGDQGTGLGLPLSLRLARVMGGDLTFTSKKDEGSRFVFTFPSRPADETPAQDVPAQPHETSRTRTVLIAEDNELNREIMTELLEGAGYETVLAENGQAAVDAFMNAPVGAIGTVLMDLLMPVMNGFEAAAAIRASGKADAGTVKIIACTANSSDEDRARAKASGMDEFLTKPVDMDALMALLEAL